MAVMFMLIQTLDDENDLSQSRMIFVAAAMICAWFGRFPIGNHNPMKTLKFCIPYLIIGMASTIASAMFFYPVYG